MIPLTPLFCWRAYRRRSRISVILALCAAACAAIQIATIVWNPIEMTKAEIARDTPNDLLEEFEKFAFAIPELNLKIVPPPGMNALSGRESESQQPTKKRRLTIRTTPVKRYGRSDLRPSRIGQTNQRTL